MSKDTIYREDAINLLWYFQDECCSAVVGDFEKLPSADRPQGYWTKTDVATYRCSECGKKHEQSEMIRTRFSDNGWLCQECYEKATDFVTDEDCGYLEDEEW